MHQQGSLLSGSNVMDVGPGCSVKAWHHLPWTPIRGHAWPPLLQRSCRNWKGRAGCCWKAVAKAGFGANGLTAPAPQFIVVQTLSQAGLKVCRCPLCPLSSSLLKTEYSACCWRLVCSPHCSGHWTGRNNHWVVLAVLPQTLKMEETVAKKKSQSEPN